MTQEGDPSSFGLVGARNGLGEECRRGRRHSDRFAGQGSRQCDWQARRRLGRPPGCQFSPHRNHTSAVGFSIVKRRMSGGPYG